MSRLAELMRGYVHTFYDHVCSTAAAAAAQRPLLWPLPSLEIMDPLLFPLPLQFSFISLSS